MQVFTFELTSQYNLVAFSSRCQIVTTNACMYTGRDECVGECQGFLCHSRSLYSVLVFFCLIVSQQEYYKGLMHISLFIPAPCRSPGRFLSAELLFFIGYRPLVAHEPNTVR
uniref:Uncharacterized protein n=1 Tax=Sphaerodactylus townsendi TaxID=933632 RepID=A0ACB8G8K7_9SAUR